MSEQPRSLAASWAAFEASSGLLQAPESQRREMRRAYYIGAQNLLRMMMAGVSNEPDATPADLAFMETIDAEFITFGQAVERGEA